MASRATSWALSSVWASKAVAAATAKGPPEPTAATSSSGSITSPVPLTSRLARFRQSILQVGDEQEGFQVPQHLVGAPVARQLHRGAPEVALVLLQLVLETGKQRKCVGGRTRETRQDLVAMEAAYLAGRRFQYLRTLGDLAVPRQNDLAVSSNAQNGCGANLRTELQQTPLYWNVLGQLPPLVARASRRAVSAFLPTCPPPHPRSPTLIFL